MNSFFDGAPRGENSWRPADFEDDGYTIEVTYRNDQGEEYVDITDSYGKFIRCWPGCGGEWPACKHSCPVWNHRTAKCMIEDYLLRESHPGYDPFDAIRLRARFIDEDNERYVEQFETLDGIQWEIAVDLDAQPDDVWAP